MLQANVLVSEDGSSILADFGLLDAATGSKHQRCDTLGTGAATYR